MGSFFLVMGFLFLLPFLKISSDTESVMVRPQCGDMKALFSVEFMAHDLLTVR